MGYLGAVGLKFKMRPMERATFFSAWATKKLRGVCVCASALYGNAATRMSEIVPSDGAYAYIYSSARGFLGPRWVTFGRSRVRESRTLGSVGAKAKWLSYPTIP